MKYSHMIIIIQWWYFKGTKNSLRNCIHSNNAWKRSWAV